MMRKLYFILMMIFLNLLSFSQGFEKSDLIVGTTIGLSWGLGSRFQVEYALTDYVGIGCNYVFSDFSNNKWNKVENKELSDKFSYKVSRYSAFFSINGYPHSSFDPYFKLGFGYNDYTLPTPDEVPPPYQSEWYTEVQFGLRYFLPNLPLSFHIETGQPIILGAGIEFKFK
jgi:hypothetical protein